MRCVNCGRQAAADDTGCPYCGCPVLSRNSDIADERRTSEARRLFDEVAGRPALRVVPIRPSVAPARPTGVDAALVVALWTLLQIPALFVLGVADLPAAWLVGPLAALFELGVLHRIGARPWFRRPAAPMEDTHDDRSDPAVHSRVSGL